MITSLLHDELEILRANHIYRKLRTLEAAGPTRASLDGREILLFCGNDYLGLSHHPRVVSAMKNSVERDGAGAGAARLISGTHQLHTQLEEKLAAFKGKEAALVFSAGYLANLGVLSALAGSSDVILIDKLCHASLIDGARLSGATLRTFPHKNYGRAEEILKNSDEFQKRILVTDTLFSMDGDFADMKELVRLKKKYHCLLVADDAHGTGVMGSGGRGAVEDGDLAAEISVLTGTLSKALGALGGFAAADRVTIDYLINFARPFIFATALPPALCAAALESLKIIEEDPGLRRKLWDNVEFLKKEFSRIGMAYPPENSPIIPVMIGEESKAVEISEKLLQEGVLVPAIRTPTVAKRKARLRVTVSAVHEKEDIQKLAEGLCKLM